MTPPVWVWVVLRHHHGLMGDQVICVTYDELEADKRIADAMLRDQQMSYNGVQYPKTRRRIERTTA